MRVLVVDDNALIRIGVRVSLTEVDASTEVLVAGDGDEALRLAREESPDVVLLDVHMPGRDGLSVLAEILEHAPVIMLTNTDDRDVVERAMRAGAAGYVVHGQLDGRGLHDAIRACLAGGTITVGLSLWDRPAPASDDDPTHGVRDLLSRREQEVMDVIATGATNAQVAARLYLSEKTVKNHVNSIFAKLGVVGRAQAVALWLTGGSQGPPTRQELGPEQALGRS